MVGCSPGDCTNSGTTEHITYIEIYELFIYFISSSYIPFNRLSFCFVNVSLCCERDFKFNYVLFVYFCFVSFALRNSSKTYCYKLCQSVLPMFFSRSFMVSSLTFRSFTQFELIFVYDVRKCSNFLLLHVAFQVPQHHFLKTVFFCYLFMPLYCRLTDHKCVGLFLGSLFCYTALCACFSAHVILF